MDSTSLEFSQIARDEAVVLFPTFAGRSPDRRTWQVAVRGVVYRAGRQAMRQQVTMRLLRRAMKHEPELLESDLFRARAAPFLCAGQPGRRLAVRIGERRLLLPGRSARSGHFRGDLVVPAEELAEGRLEVLLPPDDPRCIESPVQWLESEGWSVVSDIDDTIKHTQVTCRKSLLTNTFLRAFRAIEGMAARYAEWSRQGAAFHYVSRSPWQLYEPLAEFLATAGFPEGSLHLSQHRLREQMLRRLSLAQGRAKARAIAEIVERRPLRRYVMVGDSGEFDGEVYAAVARKFPGRVAAVFLRDLPEAPFSPGRLKRLQARSPATHWRLFRTAEDLPLAPGGDWRAD